MSKKLSNPYRNFPDAVTLGYSPIDEHINDQVDLIPLSYMRYRTIYYTALKQLHAENEGLPRHEQFGWMMTNPENEDDQYVISTTLSRKFREETQMPRGAVLRKEIKALEANLFTSNVKAMMFKNIGEQLLNAYLFKWTHYTHHYSNLTCEDGLTEFYARKEALWIEIDALWSENAGPSLRFIHGVFNEIARLYFKPMSLDRFYVMSRLIRESKGYEFLVIKHGSTGKHKENIKFTSDAKMIAIDEMFDRNKKMPEVLDTVNAYLRSVRKDPTVSIDIKTLQRFLCQKSVKNFIAIRRYEGDTGARNNVLPYLNRNRTTRACSQFQIDTVDIPLATAEFVINFVETNENKFEVDRLPEEIKQKRKLGRHLKLCRVVDNFSALTVGWSVDVSENRYMIIDALKQALRHTRVIPYELLTDNHRSYETPEFVRIVQLLELYGCRFRQQKLSHPQDKSIIEVQGRDMHAIWRTYSGYTGHGVKSRRPDSHIGKSYRKKIHRQEHVRDVDAIKALIPEVLTKFANHSFNGKPSQFETYKSSPPIEADRRIEDHQIAKLFFEETLVSVSHAGFEFTLKGTLHRYKIYNTDHSLELSNAVVRCRYEELDLSTVYLFSQQKDLFICSAHEFHNVGAIFEDMTEEQIKTFHEHNANVGSMEEDLKQRLAAHDEKMEALMEDLKIDFNEDAKKAPVYPQEILDDYIIQQKLFERATTEVAPVVVTHMDRVRVQPRDLKLSTDSIDVIEEIDLNLN